MPRDVVESFVVDPADAVATIKPIADRITRMLRKGATVKSFKLDADEENVIVTFEVP